MYTLIFTSFTLTFLSTLLVHNVYSLDIEQILKAQDAPDGSFIHHVQVFVGEVDCGGAILDENIVITAAHCVTDGREIIFDETVTVYAGSLNSVATENIISREVDRIYIPASYDNNTNIGDIAILRLKNPLEIKKNRSILRRVRIPNDKKETLKNNKRIHISGFGWKKIIIYKNCETNKIVGIDGESSDTLQYAEVEIVPQSKCYQQWLHPKGSSGEVVRVITDDFICGKIKANQIITDKNLALKGVCVGDSGSALIQGNFILGVTSFGSGLCKDEEQSTVYVKVSKYLSFIQKAMEDDINDPEIIYADIQKIQPRKLTVNAKIFTKCVETLMN